MFVTRIIVSFFVGGIFIALQTLIAERVPRSLRGIVLTIPSTLALGLFFIGITNGSASITPAATSAVIATLTCTYVFATAFVYFSRRGLLAGLLGSFIIWGINAFLLIKFPIHTFGKALLLGIPVLIILYILVRRLPQNHSLTPAPFTGRHIAIRSVVAGSIVALTVVLAKTLGNVWGGIFSSFPAVFSTTLAIYYTVHGRHVIPAVVQSLFFPGAIGFLLYEFCAAYLASRFGNWIALLGSYIIVFIFFIIWYQVANKRRNEKT